jgi:hypothetical protein
LFPSLVSSKQQETFARFLSASGANRTPASKFEQLGVRVREIKSEPGTMHTVPSLMPPDDSVRVSGDAMRDELSPEEVEKQQREYEWNMLLIMWIRHPVGGEI